MNPYLFNKTLAIVFHCEKTAVKMTRYVGVSWHKGRKAWRVMRTCKEAGGNWKHCWGGLFADEIEAAIASDKLAQKLISEGKRTKAELNFPQIVTICMSWTFKKSV